MAEGVSLRVIAGAFFYGLRFDIYSIIIINALFVLGHIIPNKKFYTHSFQKLLRFVFYLFNIPALLISCVDFSYFGFTRKRTTSDLFTSAMAGDIKYNMGIYIRDFWFILIILTALILIMEWLYRKIKTVQPDYPFSFIRSSVVFIVAAGLSVIGARGGLQFKPIGMQSAARYVPQELIPVTINTPFAIIKTIGKESLPSTSYLESDKAEQLFPVYHTLQHPLPMNKMNVMIIIMESFSNEYIGFLNNGKGYTPFLDSLCSKSLVFPNAYANAKRSIEGIPAITASIPHMMEESFISSVYNTNAINGIAGILNKEGYSSAFFHGGNNGTMGLENFSVFAGFEKYFGRDEYEGREGDYDGNWGIFDVPFFHFTKKHLDNMNKPFCIAFFSLSSHHPYTIPEPHKNAFPKGTIPIHESIGYADFALQTFFDEAKNASWFNNTLFIITADHTGPAEARHAMTSKGIFEVPLVFYCPSDPGLRGVNNNTAQQSDILPSVLDYLHYSGSFSAFGKSVFSNSEPFAITYANSIFQGIDNKYILMFDGDAGSSIALYNHVEDTLLTENIYEEKKDDCILLELKVKAAIQQFRNKMTENSILRK